MLSKGYFVLHPDGLLQHLHWVCKRQNCPFYCQFCCCHLLSLPPLLVSHSVFVVITNLCYVVD